MMLLKNYPKYSVFTGEEHDQPTHIAMANK